MGTGRCLRLSHTSVAVALLTLVLESFVCARVNAADVRNVQVTREEGAYAVSFDLSLALEPG
ncbi:MAG: hypothetical protein ACE5LB_16130, partial [Acidiferrobacterales bacterium]